MEGMRTGKEAACLQTSALSGDSHLGSCGLDHYVVLEVRPRTLCMLVSASHVLYHCYCVMLCYCEYEISKYRAVLFLEMTQGQVPGHQYDAQLSSQHPDSEAGQS